MLIALHVQNTSNCSLIIAPAGTGCMYRYPLSMCILNNFNSDRLCPVLFTCTLASEKACQNTVHCACVRARARVLFCFEKNTKTNHGLNIALVVPKEVLLPICLSSLFEIFTNWQSFRLKIQFEVIKFKFTAIHVRCFRDLATWKVQFTCTAVIICFYPREVRWLSNLSVQTFVDWQLSRLQTSEKNVFQNRPLYRETREMLTTNEMHGR